MQIVIDTESGIEPSVQLHEQLRELIVFGTYYPGRILPTQKEIQKQLSLANNTIQRAFAALTQEGLIEGKTSAGTVALEPTREAILAVAASRMRATVKELLGLALTEDELQKLLSDTCAAMLRGRGGDRRGIRTMSIDGVERRKDQRRRATGEAD